jgi:hypothetical protein
VRLARPDRPVPGVDITTGRIKTDRATGQELYTIQLMALDEKGGEVITVTVAGLVREIPVGTPVSLVELEASRSGERPEQHAVVDDVRQVPVQESCR